MRVCAVWRRREVGEPEHGPGELDGECDVVRGPNEAMGTEGREIKNTTADEPIETQKDGAQDEDPTSGEPLEQTPRIPKARSAEIKRIGRARDDKTIEKGGNSHGHGPDQANHASLPKRKPGPTCVGTVVDAGLLDNVFERDSRERKHEIEPGMKKSERKNERPVAFHGGSFACLPCPGSESSVAECCLALVPQYNFGARMGQALPVALWSVVGPMSLICPITSIASQARGACAGRARSRRDARTTNAAINAKTAFRHGLRH